MRDNIKPVEAGFFKYCMKNLSHEGDCFKYWPFRENLSIRDIIDAYCGKYKVPKKAIHRIVNKWIYKGIARRNHFNPAVGFSFCFDALPSEYIAYIPRRVLRKCPVFCNIVKHGSAWRAYKETFRYKTVINGRDDINAIFETDYDYWASTAFTRDKYNSAVQYLLSKPLECMDQKYVEHLAKWVCHWAFKLAKDNALHVICDDVHEVIKALSRAQEFMPDNTLRSIYGSAEECINLLKEY